MTEKARADGNNKNREIGWTRGARPIKLGSVRLGMGTVGTVGAATLVACAAGAAVLLGACGSNHNVSAWGPSGSPKISMFVMPPDLQGHVDGMSSSSDLEGFEVERELHGDAAGTHYVARSFHGPRVLGRDQRAIRVATAAGVILALGPIEPRATVRTEPDDLVAGLQLDGEGSADPGADGKVFRSMTDLTGDGTLDIVAQTEDGVLAVYSLGPRGATRVEVVMAALPTRGEDVDGDGKVDLWGEVDANEKDPIAPVFTDVATFDGRKFSNQTAAAKAWHRSEAEAVAVDAPTMAGTAVGLRRALERAWHGVLAGGDRKEALEALEKARPDASLRPAFERHRERIVGL